MLEKPDIPNEKISACLKDEYNLQVNHIEFLPLGADFNTAVYRITTNTNIAYFLKLRNGRFNKITIKLPKFLHDQGITQIIPPIETTRGQLWGTVAPFKTILYPFVAGQDGYESRMSQHHWETFGKTLKQIHITTIPTTFARHIRRETYSAKGRDAVKAFLNQVDNDNFDDATATKLAAFLRGNRAQVSDLVLRAETLAQRLQEQPPQFIMCHSDIHAGNILIGADGNLYIVDWDELILAPKEKDLMYIGGGLLASGRAPQEEESLFYQAYGQTEINAIALAYFRYERIIQDIYEYCEQPLLTNDGGEDREQSLMLRQGMNPWLILQRPMACF